MKSMRLFPDIIAFITGGFSSTCLVKKGVTLRAKMVKACYIYGYKGAHRVAVTVLRCAVCWYAGVDNLVYIRC